MCAGDAFLCVFACITVVASESFCWWLRIRCNSPSMSMDFMNMLGGRRILNSSGSAPWSDRLESRSAPGISFPGL